MAKQPIELSDIERLSKSESPDLEKSIEDFLGLPDPTPEGGVPEGALTADGLGYALGAARRRRSKKDRRKEALEVWARFLAQSDPPLPPRFKLGEVMVELYGRGTAGARQTLLELITKAPLVYGLWAGFRRVLRAAEAKLDAEVLGALIARFDIEAVRWAARKDVSSGTLTYLRRRGWRLLRRVGEQTPELYPQLAAQVLRHYTADVPFAALWVANHIWAHNEGHDARRFGFWQLPDDLVKKRAFPEAWQRAPEALMFVLETAQSDPPAKFAIQSLRKDFPDKLRTITPAWLARLAPRPLATAHEFLIDVLEGSPELHQGKLRGLGLHDAVLSLLLSPSTKARKYAIEYARAHAQDMSIEQIVKLLSNGEAGVIEVARSIVTSRKPRDLGVETLGRLLSFEATNGFATKALRESFDKKELSHAQLRTWLFGDDNQLQFVTKYIDDKYPDGQIGSRFWTDVLDQEKDRDNWQVRNAALTALSSLPVASIDAGWLLAGLMNEQFGYQVAQWVAKAEKLPGLDVEKLKGMVFSARHRHVALEVLGNTKLVKMRDMGLPWLLALARRADPSMSEFASRYLLEHTKPADFGESGDRKAGIERLFSLAFGEKEPEPVRVFAQTYLRCHHPVVGPEQLETKQFGLTPQLGREDFDAERIWQAAFDERADVRRFAVAILRAELRAWGLHTRVYELAQSEHKEVRNVAYDALLKAGTPQADAAIALSLDEIDAAKVFAMTESVRRATREVGMELIRRHYGRLGGAERLGWLMQSADREVRLFAVRLLWEKHRPRGLPAGWAPKKKGAVPLEQAGRFADVDALRGLLRRMLFGLPPGRSLDPALEAQGERRGKVAAGVVKRNLVDLVRDMGVEDAAFAELVAPVLVEFTGSLAKGEWESCLSALVQLRRAHPELSLGGFAQGSN